MFLVSVQFASAKTVDEVIDKYMAARGGRGKLNAIKSIYMEGFTNRSGKDIAITIIKENELLCRTTFESDDQKSFTLITPKNAWAYVPATMYEAEKLNS